MRTVNALAAPSATEPPHSDQDHPRGTRVRTTCSSTSPMRASVTRTSTPSAATGARSPTRRSSVTKSSDSFTAVGSEVTKHQVGDRVGVGCESSSCGHCEQCVKGQQVYCLNGNLQTYNGVDDDGTITQGGYSEAIVVNEDFVLKVPESLNLRRLRRCCVPASPCTRRSSTGTSAPAARSPSSASADSDTSV